MNKMILLAALAMMSCTSATVNDPDVVDTFGLGSVPASGVSGPLAPVTFSHQTDLSGVLSKVEKVSNNVTVNVVQLTLNSDSDLSWVSQVDVSIQTDNMPATRFATYSASGDPGSQISLQLWLDSNTTLQYLSQPATLTFTVSGTAPAQTSDLTGSMQVALSGSFNKSL